MSLASVECADMPLMLQPVRIETGGPDEDGYLVFADGRLVAVLVRLSEQHEDAAGLWYYEHGFGPYDGPAHPVFPTLEAAQDWIEQRHGRARRSPPVPPPIGEP
jgi:hypothetical protein